MTELSISTIASPSELSAADTDAMFYVVSRRKFTILFLATLGFYSTYWFYKNWDRVKDASSYATDAKSTIWPLPRAIFAVFFVHALFKKIKEHGKEKQQVRLWGNAAHANGVVVLLLLTNVLDRLAGKDIGSPYFDVLSLLILAPTLPVFLAAQDIINVTCNDPKGACNDKLTKANAVWIGLGVIFWCLLLLGIVLPDPA
jgi:hypothetical protein